MLVRGAVLLVLLPAVLGQTFCISDIDCGIGSKCTPVMNWSYKTCQPTTVVNIGDGVKPTTARLPFIECQTDRDCHPRQTCRTALNGDMLCKDNDQVVYCIRDSDCRTGEKCNLQPDRSTICQITVGGNVGMRSGTQNTACNRDSDCQGSLRCVDYYGENMCMIVTGDVVSPSIACDRSADCPRGQECIYRVDSGRMVCLYVSEYRPMVSGPSILPVSSAVAVGNGSVPSLPVAGGAVPITPKTPTTPSYRPYGDASTHPGPVVGKSVPVRKTVDMVVPTLPPLPETNYKPYGDVGMNNDPVPMEPFSASIIDTSPPSATLSSVHPTLQPSYDVMAPVPVPKQAFIDPAAMPCDFDYQCRMGESCSGVIPMVEGNITVCQYDVMKTNRLCIYHADCLQGQKCTKNGTGSFVCEASLGAAMGAEPCQYDYECSGGEKCQNIGDDNKKVFRCRQSDFADPRRNQRCANNAQCPYQQVCRRVSSVSMCVDVGSVLATSQGKDIQRRLVEFVHDLLFAKS